MMAVLDEAGFVWDVATGTVAKQLKRDKRELKRQERELDSMRTTLTKLQPSDAKAVAAEKVSAASRAYQSAAADMDLAVVKHNEMADAISDWTLGMYHPGTVSLSGMGAVPFAAAAGWIAAFLVVYLVLTTATAGAVNVAAAGVNRSKSFLGEASDALKNAGAAFWDFASGVTMMAWTAAAIAVGFVAYREFKGRRGRKSAPITTALAPPRLVEAEVVG